MSDIHPEDIGLVPYDYVGDVSELETAAKTVVAAINELKENGGGGAIGTFEQKYHVGENNIILGKNNYIYGNNNFIIGDDNVVCGDNLIVIGNKKQLHKNPDYSYDYADIPGGKLYFYLYNANSLDISVGDKVLLSTYISYTTKDGDDWLSTETLPYLAEVISVDYQNNIVAVDSIQMPTEEVPPEFIYREYEYVSVYTFFNDGYKAVGNFGVSTGNLAGGTNTFTANAGTASSNYSFAANSGTAKKRSSFAVNSGEADGECSFAANYGKTYSYYGAAFNYAYCYSGYSMAINCGRTAGRAIKCVSLNCTEDSVTAASGENVSNLTGVYVIVRFKNNANTIIHRYTKVLKVSGQKLYVDTDLGWGGFGEALMPDGYIFICEEYYSYNFASGNSMAGQYYSQAHGMSTLAVHEGSVIYGKYGITPENYSFSLANGSSYSAQGLAVKMLQNGNIYADGTLSSPCADYAEFFEWADGNPDNEDRAGLFVTLEEDKIKLACDFSDFVLGVVSAAPAIIGDTGELRWSGKYLTDDFGRILYEPVTIPAEYDKYNEDGTPADKSVIIKEETVENQPVLNPNWNSDAEYIPRSKRKEWSAVGVMGKLRVRDDGTCISGGMCRASAGGIATKSINNGYRVLKRITDNIILIWVR